MQTMEQLDKDARNLLADAGYAGVELVRVEPESILFTMESRPFTAWKHQPVKTVKTNTGNRIESEGPVVVHVESGFRAMESDYYEADAA